jgi:uncharacterized protein (TIGR03435 family)
MHAILGQRRGFSRFAAIVSVVALLVLVGPLNRPGAAQSTGTRVEFEVASIKPFPHPVMGSSMSYNAWMSMARSSSHGQFNLVMVNLKGLLMAAYGVSDFQIVGGPAWIEQDGYDVIAKAGGNATYDQMKPMLQSLLASRFRLTLHRETRQLPVSELAVAKGGLKITPSKVGGCLTLDPAVRLPLGSKICGGVGRRVYELTAYAISMPEFLDNLASIVGRIVIDKTGFKGRFDVDLKFDPCSSLGGIAPNSPNCADFSSYPSISTSLQEQLGTRLVSTRGSVEVLVSSWFR